MLNKNIAIGAGAVVGLVVVASIVFSSSEKEALHVEDEKVEKETRVVEHFKPFEKVEQEVKPVKKSFEEVVEIVREKSAAKKEANSQNYSGKNDYNSYYSTGESSSSSSYPEVETNGFKQEKRSYSVQEVQKILKEKITSRALEPVYTSSGMALTFSSSDNTKIATIYSDKKPYDPVTSSTPPPAPVVYEIKGVGTSVIPGEYIAPNVQSVAAVTDQDGNTQYIDINDEIAKQSEQSEDAPPTQESIDETQNQDANTDTNEKINEEDDSKVIVISAPPNIGS
ncbi:MAG: hypothetical protein U9N42_02110 [Campylobacterota bacterium]|nr:hypothetical protein [Campylobacterota bacterium]